jgi:hypothetical protein
VVAGLGLLLALLPRAAFAIATTTVQGTIYRADGSVASGTLLLSWPAFTTAANEAVASGSIKVAIGQDGSVNLSLAPNAGASPDGSYYTAVYHLNDGSTSTEYWTVPSAANTSIASIRARIMPAVMAMQSVSKQYVDNSVTFAASGFLSLKGGSMLGPLTLSTDPTLVQQAATKHYVDQAASSLLPTAGGVMTGSLVLAGAPTSAFQASTKGYVDQAAASLVQRNGDTMTGPLVAPMVNGKVYPIGTSLQQAINSAGTTGSIEIPANYSGTDNFRNPNGLPVMDQSVTIPMNGRNVKEFGARCAGPTGLNGTIAAGSSILTVTYGTPTTAMIGDYVVPQVQYTSLVFPSAYMPTVTGIIDSTHVQLSAATPIPITTATSFLIYQDDGPQIQDALNWTYNTGQTLFFPDGMCFVAHPLTYRCQSMRGTGGMGGLGAHWSSIQSAPATDIFAGTDPTDSGVSSCTSDYTSVRDLTLLVDASVDATKTTGWASKKRWSHQRSAIANNPASWTGQTLGAAKAVGDTTLTLSTTPVLNQSWGVAQIGAVQIGSNVCNYYGIIGAALQNVTCGMQGTTDVSSSAGTAIAPVNPWAYTDTADDIPAYEIGNCAFVFPSRDGSALAFTAIGPGYKQNDVRVIADNVPNNNGNNTCGWFLQALPYGSGWDNIHARGTTFGWIGAQVASNIDQEIRSQATMDAATFRRLEIHAPVPFLGTSGQLVTADNWQLYSGSPDQVHMPSRGIFILQPYDPACSGCVFKQMPLDNWVVTNMYNEPGYLNGQGQYYGPYVQIQGTQHTFEGGALGGAPTQPLIWDASNSSTENTFLGGSYGGSVPSEIINGNSNTFTNAGFLGIGSTGWINNGLNNSRTSSPAYSAGMVYQTPTRVGSRNTVTPDFLRGGNVNSDWYQSLDDLFLTPERMINYGVQTIGSAAVNDATAPVTRRYVAIAPTGMVDFRIEGGAGQWTVGQNFPKGKGVLYIMARPAVTATMAIRMYNEHGSMLVNTTCSWTAAVWSSCTNAFDASSLAVGDTIHFDSYDGAHGGISASTPATEIDVAWISVVPDMGSLNAGTINASTALQVGGVAVKPALSGTSASLGGTALVAGACASGTVSVTSSTTAMAVDVSPVTYPGDGIYWSGYVSAAGTVTVKVCATVAATPTASTYNVRVIQ